MIIKKTVEIDISQQYLDKILTMTTSDQLDMFKKMYPDGPKNSQLPVAISQVERTILNLNNRVELLRHVEIKYKKVVLEYKEQLAAKDEELSSTREELKEAQRELALMSSSVDVNQVEVQRKLALLAALEAAGVDNWEGYYLARELL